MLSRASPCWRRRPRLVHGGRGRVRSRAGGGGAGRRIEGWIGQGFRQESMTYTGLLGESCLKQAMASICTDRGAGQGHAQRAGSAGRRSLTSAAIGA